MDGVGRGGEDHGIREKGRTGAVEGRGWEGEALFKQPYYPCLRFAGYAFPLRRENRTVNGTPPHELCLPLSASWPSWSDGSRAISYVRDAISSRKNRSSCLSA